MEACDVFAVKTVSRTEATSAWLTAGAAPTSATMIGTVMVVVFLLGFLVYKEGRLGVSKKRSLIENQGREKGPLHTRRRGEKESLGDAVAKRRQIGDDGGGWMVWR